MKLRRLLYRKLSRLGTLQDLVHIVRRPPKQVVKIRHIGDQSAGLDVLAEGIDGGQFVLDRKLRDAAALAHQKGVRRYHESVWPIFCYRHERGIEGCSVVDLVDGEGYVQHLRALSRTLQCKRHTVIPGVEENGDLRNAGNHVLQQLQPLCLELGSARGAPCNVSARQCQIRHNTAADGIANGSHNNGYRCGGLLSSEHGVGPPSKYHVYVEADEVIRQLGKSLVVSSGVAVLEAKVLTLDIPKIIESLSKRVDGWPALDRQDTDRDYFPSRPLRICGERPSSRTGDQSDELTTPHSIT